MSLYSERAFFDGDHCQHVADRDEHARLTRARNKSTEAVRRASRQMAMNNLLVDLVCADIAGGQS